MATIRFGDFEWDDEKSASNVRKHHVTFEDAVEVFLDSNALHVADAAHPDRICALGFARFPRMLFVVYIEKMDTGALRIISARKATKKERRGYEKAYR